MRSLDQYVWSIRFRAYKNRPPLHFLWMNVFNRDFGPLVGNLSKGAMRLKVYVGANLA